MPRAICVYLPPLLAKCSAGCALMLIVNWNKKNKAGGLPCVVAQAVQYVTHSLQRWENSKDTDKDRFEVGSKSTLFDVFFPDLSDLLQNNRTGHSDSLCGARSLQRPVLYGSFHLLSYLQSFSKLRKRKTKRKAPHASHFHL